MRERVDGADVIHHVTNRGARRDLVFFDDRDRDFFLGLLVEVAAKLGTEIHAYCLLGNHFHLILRSAGDLSATMQQLCSPYVRTFNRRHGFDGPLCAGRFHNVVIESDAQLAAASRYVHRNPADLCQGQLERYPWSSYRHYVGPELRVPAWLHRDLTLGLFGHDVRRYRRFVETTSAESGEPARSGGASPQVAAQPYAAGIDPTAGIEEVTHAVAAAALVDVADLTSAQPGVRNPARLAVFVLAEERGLATRALTTAMGGVQESSAKRLVRRGRRRVEADPAFARLLDQARRLLDEPPVDQAA